MKKNLSFDIVKNKHPEKCSTPFYSLPVKSSLIKLFAIKKHLKSAIKS